MNTLAAVVENPVSALIILLGILVTVHEYGHYLAARLIGVTVEIFSIGFGPSIFAFKRGDTEFRVAFIPLGGFVKMFGDNYDDTIADADRSRAFVTQPPGKKALIAFAGPAFNFILAVVIYAILAMVGTPAVAPQLGYVVPGGAAHHAGLKAGDAIQTIDGRTITTWNDFVKVIANHAGTPLKVTINRHGKSFMKMVTPIADLGTDIYGIPKTKGLVGVTADRPLAAIRPSDANSIFAKAGFLPGDIITAVNDKPVATYGQLIDRLDEVPQPHRLSVKRAQNGVLTDEKKNPQQIIEVQVGHQPGVSKAVAYGFLRSGVVIQTVKPNSVAEGAGLKRFDVIIGVDDHVIDSLYAFNKYCMLSKEKDHQLKILRGYEEHSISVSLKRVSVRNRFGIESERWQIGLVPFVEFTGPKIITEQTYNPFKALYRGMAKSYHVTLTMFVGITKIFTGDVSMNALGGPLTIAKFASESVKVGLLAFLSAIALISLNLGLVNLFPIPVLDGGHLVLCAIEGITRKPINKKALAIAYGIGFWIIISLLLFTLIADFGRFSDQLWTWFKGIFGLS